MLNEKLISPQLDKREDSITSQFQSHGRGSVVTFLIILSENQQQKMNLILILRKIMHKNQQEKAIKIKVI